MRKNVFERIAAFVLALVLVLGCVATASAGYRWLYPGDDNGYVRELQKELKKQGYYTGNLDGFYGPGTRAAVIAFQKAAGLDADGVAGQETQSALYSKSYKDHSGTVEAGSDTEIRKLQTALKKKGFYKGAIDGQLGPATVKAIKAFQKSVGLTVDGRAGNKTKAALYEGKSAVNTTDDVERKAELAGKKVPSNPRTLYYGCTGARVKSLQRALKSLGFYKGSIDGVYGDLTYKAVKRYQSSKKMHADGIAGPQTLKSINSHVKKNQKISTTFTIDIGSSGDTVASLKSWLKGKSYNVDTSTDTYTAQDKEEVKKWQSNNNKTVTGTITESQYNRIVLGKEEGSK